MNSSLLKNFLSLTGAEAISKLLTFLAFAFLARKLGTVSYGYIEWAAAILMCASLIVDQGFSAYGAREIARGSRPTTELVSQIVTARFLLAGVAYLASSLLAIVYVDDVAVRDLVLVFALSLWLLPLLLQWVFQGHDRMHFVSITQVVRQMVFAGVIFGFVATASDIVVVGIAEIAAVGAAALLSCIFYMKVFPPQGGVKPSLSSETFRTGGTIGLSQLFWVVKMFGATVIVGMIALPAETGEFAAAMRIFIALHTFVWLYFFNLLPSLSRAWVDGGEDFSSLLRSSMRLVVWVAVPACILGLLAAPYAMTLVYGADFGRGAGALRWLAVACLFAAVSGHFRFGLIAAGFQSREMIASAAGAATAVILIPVGYFAGGISLAALGLCVAEIVILAVSWVQARRVLYNDDRQAVVSSDYSLTVG